MKKPEEQPTTDSPPLRVIEIEEDWLWEKIIRQETRAIAVRIFDSAGPISLTDQLPITPNNGLVLMHGEDVAGVFVTHVRSEPVPTLDGYLFSQIMRTDPGTQMDELVMVIVFEPFPGLDQVLHEAKNN